MQVLRGGFEVGAGFKGVLEVHAGFKGVLEVALVQFLRGSWMFVQVLRGAELPEHLCRFTGDARCLCRF